MTAVELDPPDKNPPVATALADGDESHMTAAEFRHKWFDDAEALRVFTAPFPPPLPTGEERHWPPLDIGNAAQDYASLTPEDKAIVAGQFPPHIWHSLSMFKETQ